MEKFGSGPGITIPDPQHRLHTYVFLYYFSMIKNATLINFFSFSAAMKRRFTAENEEISDVHI
jgi:hypothetical protein